MQCSVIWIRKTIFHGVEKRSYSRCRSMPTIRQRQILSKASTDVLFFWTRESDSTNKPSDISLTRINREPSTWYTWRNWKAARSQFWAATNLCQGIWASWIKFSPYLFCYRNGSLCCDRIFVEAILMMLPVIDNCDCDFKVRLTYSEKCRSCVRFRVHPKPDKKKARKGHGMRGRGI